MLEPPPLPRVEKALFDGESMRSCLLWLLGVPIPIIILIWLLTGHA
jgi:hypothetical protein